MNDFIPVSAPLLNGNEKKYLLECIETGWISSAGPFVKRFENEFATYIGTKYGVAVCNGTAALETALYGLGVRKGDEVIMPSFTIISCALACLRLGAKPVLVDINPQIWTMDIDLVESLITDRTKVVMPVHIYGHPVHMDELFRLRDYYGFKILEDAAEAHGAEYFSKYHGDEWLKCGALGDISATSFYANKIITTGEGGIVNTDDKKIAQRAESYRNLCFRNDKRFYHTELGYNFRMSNLQAALGVAQLEQISHFISIKRALAKRYKKQLSTIPGIRFMEVKEWARSVYWMYAVEIHPDTGFTAEEVMLQLKKDNIGTRPFFFGLHRQPALNNLGLFHSEEYPKTDHAYKYGFYLPSSLSLQDNDIDYIVTCVKKAINK